MSVSNRLYALDCSTNLVGGFTAIETNVPATPPMNTYTDAVDRGANVFYRVEVK
jgi:hypothetical protein